MPQTHCYFYLVCLSVFTHFFDLLEKNRQPMRVLSYQNEQHTYAHGPEGTDKAVISALWHLKHERPDITLQMLRCGTGANESCVLYVFCTKRLIWKTHRTVFPDTCSYCSIGIVLPLLIYMVALFLLFQQYHVLITSNNKWNKISLMPYCVAMSSEYKLQMNRTFFFSLWLS